ncbi:MAG: NAD(+) diphosphatase [Lachnospiraceae bacterium]|nr:NAD(+) diphosphatase [Lachnospiraceae bacterium]
MIQDIAPYKYDNTYQQKRIEADDFVLLYQNNKVLLAEKEGMLTFPTFCEMKRAGAEEKEAQYAFSIDKHAFFLLGGMEVKENETLKFYDLTVFRTLEPMWKAFAGITGSQFDRWYKTRRYCGSCGTKMVKSEKERALICPKCHQMEYPKIAPAVIVAVTNGDRLLLSRYARGGYRNYALIAGFAEVGETLEDTVRREVREEVGLKVKNIRYYKSQPWSFSDSLLTGFFAELDGDDTVTLEEEELAEAVWFEREDIPHNPSKISLTNEMIEQFRKNEIKESIRI